MSTTHICGEWSSKPVSRRGKDHIFSRVMACVSADALDDEWWLDSKAEENEHKRKGSTDGETGKKKKKRKTISQELATKEVEPFGVLHSAARQKEDLHKMLISYLESNEVEMQELKLKMKHFVGYEADDEERDCPSFKDFFTTVCPKLERWLSRAQDQRGSPCVIIICSSAVRALELRQNISELCTIGTVAKLFAKHMKIEEQKKLLSESVTPVAVATPDRLARLFNDGVVGVSNLKRVILDWNWRNQKMKRLRDIPEVCTSFCQLYREHLNYLVLKQKVKLALY